ncbi:hypothetical protein D9M73_270790 [compost metagenome]
MIGIVVLFADQDAGRLGEAVEQLRRAQLLACLQIANDAQIGAVAAFRTLPFRQRRGE